MARNRPPLLAESRIALNLPPSTPTATGLLKELCSSTQEVGSCDRPKLCQQRNIANIVRRIKLLTPFLEEMRDVRPAMPPTAVVALRELYISTQRVKVLLDECRECSCIWLLMETSIYAEKFHALSQEISSALSYLPMNLLEISVDVKEQVELVRLQAKRTKPYVDPLEERVRSEVLAMMRKFEMKEVPSEDDMRQLFSKLQISTNKEFEKEKELLEEELDHLHDLNSGDSLAVAMAKSLISFVHYAKCVLNGVVIERTEDFVVDFERQETGDSQLDNSTASNIPDEFKCPISLELMRDPIIISSGQTYDRQSIQRWLESGHSTCPKSGLELTQLNLVPNYALRSLISRWCEEHKVSYRSSNKDGRRRNARDDVSTRAAMEATKLTAEFLVEKLQSGSWEVQKQVVYELRLLSKSSMDNRRLIAKAGAIPSLLPLLLSTDPKAQEDAVTTLLNLSIYNSNKKMIMEANALDIIVQVLLKGKSRDARENAAATIFSLSVMEEYKAIIGSRVEILVALVGLLRDGSSRGKKDSCTAVFSLAILHQNRPTLVAAGAVTRLVEVLKEDEELTEAALAVLGLLATSQEGLTSIVDINALPLLINYLRMGSPKAKENSAAVLLALCRHGSKRNVAESLLKMPSVIPSLYSLLTLGSQRAKHKATSLLKLLHVTEQKAFGIAQAQ